VCDICDTVDVTVYMVVFKICLETNGGRSNICLGLGLKVFLKNRPNVCVGAVEIHNNACFRFIGHDDPIAVTIMIGQIMSLVKKHVVGAICPQNRNKHPNRLIRHRGHHSVTL
jgi:hypothetical protein